MTLSQPLERQRKYSSKQWKVTKNNITNIDNADEQQNLKITYVTRS